MKKNSVIDYSLYLIAKSISLIIIFIPLRLSVYFARAIGVAAFYYFKKKRNTAYKNIKIAFPYYSYHKINRIVKKNFMNSAQHFMEIFYFPWISERYIKEFIEFEGIDTVFNIIKDKKGVIFLGLHAGSWEVSNVVLARILKEYNFTILARTQPGTPLVYRLLNEYRARNRCGIIGISDNLKEIVNHLKKGFALGVVADHGGQEGIFVDFFGRPALTPIGGVKLALKLDTHLIVGFTKRNGNAKHKIIFRPYNLIRTQNIEQDVKENLENINRIYEEHIRGNPDEYLWFFKRWKYSLQRNILVLSDGKVGHLKQSLGVLDLIKDMPFQIKHDVIEVKFKNKWQKIISVIYGLFLCLVYQGDTRYFRRIFSHSDFQKLFSNYYDVIISCGANLSVANRLIAFENMAKSIVIMKPGMLSLKRFDLVILPEHDKAIKFNNVVYIKGAVSRLIDKNNEHIKGLIQHYGLDRDSIPHPVIGLFVGGENKYLSLDMEVIKKILNSLKQSIEFLGGVLLVSTSRRTSSNIAQLLKEELRDYAKCKMLIIANESNPTGSFEAISESSDILVISGDSISMISEGINSGKYTLVFRLKRKNAFFLSKHERFINSLKDDECIYVVSEENLFSKIQDIWRNSPPKKILNEKDAVLDRLKKIL